MLAFTLPVLEAPPQLAPQHRAQGGQQGDRGLRVPHTETHPAQQEVLEVEHGVPAAVGPGLGGQLPEIVGRKFGRWCGDPGYRMRRTDVLAQPCQEFG